MKELTEALARATSSLSHISATASEKTGPQGGLCISLVGHLDSDAASALMDPMVEVIEKWEGEKRIFVDLSHLEYIASLGIGMLTMAAVAARKRGIELSLLAPQPSVLHVLELLGIPTYIPIFQKEP